MSKQQELVRKLVLIELDALTYVRSLYVILRFIASPHFKDFEQRILISQYDFLRF
jgi:hypothetical protein